MSLAEKVKTTLGETRLLILGSQIFFGFQFNAMFQDEFENLPPNVRLLDAAGFLLMASTVGCLIAPSMQHRLVEQGNDSMRIQRVASIFTAVALVPFAVSLGLALFVVLQTWLDTLAAAVVGIVFFALAIFFLVWHRTVTRRSGGVYERRTTKDSASCQNRANVDRSSSDNSRRSGVAGISVGHYSYDDL